MGPLALKPLQTGTERAASELIYEAFDEYYDLFGLEKSKIIDLISDQLSIAGSEIANTSAIFDDDGRLSAILSCLPVAELSSAQMKSTFHLLSHVEQSQKDNVLKDIKAFSAGFPDVPEDCFYLTRIVVSSINRRQNLGSHLLDKFAELGKDYPKLCLHVNAKKIAAINFYTKNGYEIFGPGDRPFVAMVKPNPTPGGL